MRRLGLVLTVIGASFLAGCDFPKRLQGSTQIEGYNVSVNTDYNQGYCLSVTDPETGSQVTAIDSSIDGTFDPEVIYNYSPKGHPLEDFCHPAKLRNAFNAAVGKESSEDNSQAYLDAREKSENGLW